MHGSCCAWAQVPVACMVQAGPDFHLQVQVCHQFFRDGKLRKWDKFLGK